MNRVTRFGRDAVLVPVVLALIAVLAAFSFAAVAPVGAQTASVSIGDFFFDSASIQVAAGTTVTWTNNGAVAHTATGDGGTFDTGSISPGGSASITFNTPGTYTYTCTIHPGQMSGTIVVTGAAADDDGTDGDAGNTTTNLPSTGAGAVFGGAAVLPLAAALIAAALLLGVAGATVLRRADR